MRSRAFRDDDDLERMAALATGPNAHRLHPGDLTWRLRFLLADHPPAELVRLWEDGDGLAGFVLLYPRLAGFDLSVGERGRGCPVESDMLDWALERLAGTVNTDVHELDRTRIELLAARGFRSRPAWVALRADVAERPRPVELPAGYAVRPLTGDDVPARAVAAGAAFAVDSSARRYRRLMAAPGYRDAVDLLVEAPDGSVAAFCVAWADEQTKVGLLEPVGTHPRHQRLGLGRALLRAAFDALAGRGMREVMVLAEDCHVTGGAQRFYRDAGMRPSHRVTSHTLER